MRKQQLAEFIRATGILMIWFIGVLILWRVLLSIRAIQQSGFAIWPYETRVYPAGLPWQVEVD